MPSGFEFELKMLDKAGDLKVQNNLLIYDDELNILLRKRGNIQIKYFVYDINIKYY